MKLKKTGNKTTKTYETELHLTDVESLTFKGALKKFGIEEDVFVVKEVVNVTTVVESTDNVLSTVKAKESERNLLVSQTQLDDYFNKNTPLVNYIPQNRDNDVFTYNSASKGLFLIRESKVNEIIKAKDFERQDNKELKPSLFTEKLEDILKSKEPLQLIELVESVNYSFAILLDKDTIIHQSIKLDIHTLHSDNYDFETLFPALTQVDNLKFLKESDRGEFTLVASNTENPKELIGVVKETPYYNQNDNNDLMDATAYFYPPVNLAKFFIEENTKDKEKTFIKQNISINSDGNYYLTGEKSPEGTFSLGQFIINVVMNLNEHAKYNSSDDNNENDIPPSPISRFMRR